MKRTLVLLLALWLVVGCGREPTTTPDLVATQVAVMEAAAVTLTAEAPTAAATSTASPTSTVGPTATRPVLPTPPPPTVTEPAPPVGPILGQFAVVNVASDDVLNVRTRPGVVHPIVGTIPYYGLDVEVHAGGQKVTGSWWVPVEYESVVGWVNSNYLARQAGWLNEAVAARAAQIIMALKDRDLQELSSLAHPDEGVRFSPYTYVRTVPGAHGGQDLVFSAAQIPGLWSDPTVYHWGTVEGSGQPIDLTFSGYYDQFIYDLDFARPDVVGFDQTIGRGSTINNIADVYPDAVSVEYHFEGFDPQVAGFDWKSLRLVLEKTGGSWYLVGIVHDEWTP